MMERKDEQKKSTTVATEETDSGVRWELTREDREFLRSCNISPE